MTKRQRRPVVCLDDNPVIGYVAALTARSMWCAGEAMIVASSEQQMCDYLRPSAGLFRLATVRWDTLRYGLQAGETYACDAVAYQRLARLAQTAGVRLTTEAMTHAAPSGAALTWVCVRCP